MTTLAPSPPATSQPDYESGGVPLLSTLPESTVADSTTTPPPHFWASPLTAEQLRLALLPTKRTARTPLPRSKLEAPKNIITTDLARLQRVADEEAYRAAVLEKRYGVARGAGALSEEEMLAYAKMISLERLEFEVRVDAGAENEGFEDEDEMQRALRLSLEEIRVEEAAPEGEVESWPTLREAEEEVRRRNVGATPGVEMDGDGEFSRQTELAVRASLEVERAIECEA